MPSTVGKESDVNPTYDFAGQVALVTGASSGMFVVGVALPVDGGYTAQ